MPEHSTAENVMNNIVEAFTGKASEHTTAENLLNDVMEKISDNSDTSMRKRLFGRQKPVHSLLGGGKSADVLLWRNKKISTGVLVGATLIWILFEWLNYNLLSFGCMALALGMIAQFFWSSASGMLKRSRSEVPRLVLPDDLFVNTAVKVGSEVNRLLAFLQDVAIGGNLKEFLIIVASLWAAAILGSWCNFLTVIYIGFVAAHTLPLLYEKYEEEIDSFVENLLGQCKNQYGKMNTSAFSRLRRGNLKWRKSE